MEKEFVPYELAVKLKALGFDEPCFGWYSSMEGNPFRLNYCETYLGIENCTKTPTFSQAFRWFRDEHKLHYEIEYNSFEYLGYVSGMTANVFNTYEEAELACLNELIEIVESKIK